MKSALRHLAWTLPALALLAGCNGGESAKPEPHAIATGCRLGLHEARLR